MKLSASECATIVRRYFRRDDVEVIRYDSVLSTEASRGLISLPNLLNVKVKIHGKTEDVQFFVKTLPTSGYHLQLVQNCRLFYKESEFYTKLYPHLEKYFTHKVFPECYLSHNEITVLENVMPLGYKNHDPLKVFDIEHCKATLKSLASYHAASFLYEHEAQTTFDKLYPECLFVSWFGHKPDHPARKHFDRAMEAMTVVLHNYFSHESEKMINDALKIIESVPLSLLPSTTHRNTLTHSDLWSNNIMFKYTNGKVDNACLIDLQLYAYHPPAHDLYSLIFMNGTYQHVEQLKELGNFYYNCFKDSIQANNQNPDDFLSYDEFEKCKTDSIRLGLGSAVLFIQFVLIPPEYISSLMSDDEQLKAFMENSRVDLVIKSIENSPVFKDRLFMSLSNIFRYLHGEMIS